MHGDQTDVLIVDDEPQVCRLIQDGLQRYGFRCGTASGARQAQHMLEDEPFDVLIVDISMPEVSGLDLLVHVRRHAPQSKVILISGVSNTDFLAKALSLGAYDYFQKPFDLGQLAKSVTAATSGQIASPQLPLRAAKAMQLEAQVCQASLESIHALVHAVEAKDPYTKRHSEQVAHYATNLADHIGVARQTIESIRTAALLHDVGKIGVPDHILTKSGPLTKEEFDQVRRHPVLGAEILQNISMLTAQARLVRYHHEHWDGSGYPEGLSGEEIPFGSRIIHLADAMDAMLMERTYKRAYPVEKMLRELCRCAGTQFEPKLAACAVKWCEGHRNRLILPDVPAA